ncbi:hypothetical protein KCU90_g7386, partial [Aureobasidium melanogenum]
MCVAIPRKPPCTPRHNRGNAQPASIRKPTIRIRNRSGTNSASSMPPNTSPSSAVEVTTFDTGSGDRLISARVPALARCAVPASVPPANAATVSSAGSAWPSAPAANTAPAGIRIKGLNERFTERSMPRRQLQPDQADHDQRRARHPRDRQSLAHHDDAEDERADRADACPHGVGRAERQLTHRHGKQNETAERGHDRKYGRPQPGKAFGGFKTGRPGNLEQTGNQQKNPGHETAP